MQDQYNGPKICTIAHKAQVELQRNKEEGKKNFPTQVLSVCFLCAQADKDDSYDKGRAEIEKYLKIIGTIVPL